MVEIGVHALNATYLNWILEIFYDITLLTYGTFLEPVPYIGHLISAYDRYICIRLNAFLYAQIRKLILKTIMQKIISLLK